MENNNGIILRNKIEVTRLISASSGELNEVSEYVGESHAGWEFIYVYSGNICVGADNFTYILKKGEMVCHKPFEFHTIKPYQGNASVIMVCFNTNDDGMDIFNNKIFSVSNRQKQYFSDIAEMGKEIFSLEGSQNFAEFREKEGMLDSFLLKEQFIKNTLELLIVSLINSDMTDKQTRMALYKQFSQRQILAQNIIEFLHENLDKSVNLNEISDKFSYSLSSIKRVFKEETGYSVISYLNNLRMQKARELLENTNLSVEDISVLTGFSNVCYFSTAFKKKWGISPLQYRFRDKQMSSINTLKKERGSDMYSYKMVIADDEKMISHSLKEMVSRECSDIDIVDVCNNGEQVINILKQTAIDIVITDIRMPVKDGLEIARYIKEEGLKTSVIVITGYREFEYARKAMEYGCKKIITKPINIDELIETIENIKDSIKSDISRVYLENEKEQRIRQLYRRAFFLLVNSNTAIDNLNIDNLKEMNLNEESCIVVDFFAEGTENLESASSYETKWQDMCEIKNDNIDAYCILEYNDYARFFIIAECNSIEEAMQHSQKFADESAILMKSAYGFKVNFKISRFADVRPVSHYNLGEIVNTYMNYLLLGCEGKREELLWIIKSSTDLETIRNFINKVINHIEKSLILDVSDIKARFKTLHSENEMLELLYEIESKVQNNPDNDSAIVGVVKNYITNYTGSDYTLKGVADAVAYTPYYLSRVFKNETGENLSAYLLNVRMERAKKLLREKQHNISTIAKMVGFDNASYFSRIFKKQTGMMPKQYSLIGEEKQ
ncbi:MAG: helix-turn-helix domain-containing protein [Clostridia bacterium]|nr:helix-turn-helix domain-containing protein [Clostridia bacterium]